MVSGSYPVIMEGWAGGEISAYLFLSAAGDVCQRTWNKRPTFRKLAKWIPKMEQRALATSFQLSIFEFGGGSLAFYSGGK